MTILDRGEITARQRAVYTEAARVYLEVHQVEAGGRADFEQLSPLEQAFTILAMAQRRLLLPVLEIAAKLPAPLPRVQAMIRQVFAEQLGDLIAHQPAEIRMAIFRSVVDQIAAQADLEVFKTRRPAPHDQEVR